jgi:hypothetical protein
MAVSPYDQAAWSTYTPLSSQEILQPALMMRERQDRLEEEYAAIDDELQKIAFIAETENDPAVQQMYNNYTAQLESGMNELMERGVTPNSRRRMLGVRSRFQSQIAPIRQAYELKRQDINQINQMKMKDPTFIGPDPTQRSLTDYLSSGLQPIGHQGISGALLTQMANQYLAPYSQELTDTDLKNLLLTTVGEENIPQYMEYIKKHGYKPGTEGHRALMEAVSNKIMESTGIRDWANEDQLRQAQGYINMAETATIGKDQSQVLNNNAFVLAAQRQAAKDAAEENSRPPLLTPTPIAGEDFENRVISPEDISTALGTNKKVKGMDRVAMSIAGIGYNDLNFSNNQSAQVAKHLFESLETLTPEELQELANSVGVPGNLAAEVNIKSMIAAPLLEMATSAMGSTLLSGLTATVATKLAPILAPLSFSGDTRRANPKEVLDYLQRAESLAFTKNMIEGLATNFNIEDPKELETAISSYYSNLSRGSGTSYSYDDASVNAYQVRDALANSRNLRENNATVLINEGKGSKKVPLDKIDKGVLDKLQDLSEKNVQGQLMYKGKPSYKLTTSIDGKNYTIIIPAISLEADYPTSSRIQEIINQGVFENTSIPGPDGSPMIISPSYENGVYNVTINWNGKEYSPEDIYKYEMLNTGLRYLHKSRSLSQVIKQE